MLHDKEQPSKKRHPITRRGFIDRTSKLAGGLIFVSSIGEGVQQTQSFDSLFPEQVPHIKRLDPVQERPEISGTSDSYRLPHGYLGDGAPYQELAWFHLYIGGGVLEKNGKVSVDAIRFPEVDYTVNLELEKYGEKGLRIRHKFDPGSTKALPRDYPEGNRDYGLDFNKPIIYTCVLREGLGPIFDLRLNGRKIYTPDTFSA